MNLFDEKEELRLALSRRNLFAFLFIIVTILYLTALFLLLFLTGDSYAPFLYLLFGLTILYAWFAIFYWSAAFPAQRRRVSFFSSILEGQKEEKTVVFKKKLKENVYQDGIYADLCRGGYRENGRECEFDFYVPSSRVSFSEGEKVKLSLFHRMLLAYEVVS